MFISRNSPTFLRSNFNLYKCFIAASHRLSTSSSIHAFLHDSGTFESKNETGFRNYLYPRLSKLFRFENQLSLFPELGHARSFEGTILHASPSNSPSFDAIFYLYHPSTIDACFSDTVNPPLPSEIKNGREHKKEWDTRGSETRIIRINNNLLSAFTRLLGAGSLEDEGGRLVSLKFMYEAEVINILASFFSSPTYRAKRFDSPPLPEKASEKDGIIKEQPGFYPDQEIRLLTGPNALIGDCFAQSCNMNYSSHQSYSLVDKDALSEASANFVPRQRYKIEDPARFNDRYNPYLPQAGVRLSDTYRLGLRKMLDNNESRSVKPFIIPPGFCHAESITSFAFENHHDLLMWAAIFSSIAFDFLFRRLGKSSFYPSDFNELRPTIDERNRSYLHQASARALVLNNVHARFAGIWHEFFSIKLTAQYRSPFSETTLLVRPTCEWSPQTMVTNPLARRLLLLEIDVLIALSFGLSLDQLTSIYKDCFPVFQSYEDSTFFDSKGRPVASTNKTLGRLAASKTTLAKNYGPEWKKALGSPGSLSITVEDEAHSDQPSSRDITFEMPAATRDRLAEYRIAWDFFGSGSNS